ncbi:bactofilin family protein [Halioxenophilus aromaticivorans]|uniref:Polymer-forming cytoskeletal protein n=1 Tax=Halioxenophilus aromaticivorans TaxID=1306992 RepID=A0AAV3U1R9_9ALTE
MFGSKKGAGAPAQSSKPASPRGGVTGTTLISKSTEITGDLKFSGSLVVEGTVTGNIVSQEGSDARLQLFDSGVVCGEIRVPSVVINGRVQGDVYASEHVELAAQAVVDGNVHYKLIEMVKGAQVNGNLVYGSKEPESEPDSGSSVVAINEDAKAVQDPEASDDSNLVAVSEDNKANNNASGGLKSRGGRRR